MSAGLAIRDYWGVDDSTIVFVADPSFGSILNFNCGQVGVRHAPVLTDDAYGSATHAAATPRPWPQLVDLEVPRSFWSRLAGQYGNQFYWKEKGENEAILNAVSAIDTCLREPQGKFKCSKIQGRMVIALPPDAEPRQHAPTCLAPCPLTAAEFGEKDRGGVFEKALGL